MYKSRIQGDEQRSIAYTKKVRRQDKAEVVAVYKSRTQDDGQRSIAEDIVLMLFSMRDSI